MSEEKPQPKPARLSREEVAKRDLGHTQVGPAHGAVLIGFFLLTIFGVPLAQFFWEFVVEEKSRPQVLRLGDLAAAGHSAWQNDDGLFGNVLQVNAATLRAIERFEDDLEDSSLLTRNLLQPVQVFMSSAFQIGNEEVYTGRDGWLYFRADVDYCTSPGFLTEDWLEDRALAGNEYTGPPQPDPRKAILQFHDQLAQRGIRLIVLPTPVKPVIYGEHLARGLEQDHLPLHNASYARFVQEMRAQGVEILDLTQSYLARKQRQDAPLYLKTDTHWSFDTMRWTARKLADFAGYTVAGNPGSQMLAGPNEVEPRVRKVAHLGDIGQMLELPENQQIFAPEEQQIKHPARELVTRGPAEILLLGDSFTNIYSMPELGWGEGAGLAEQLSEATERPVRKIAINAGGSHAARAELVRRLARGDDALAGVQVVVWQFATRELSQGDWRLMDLPEPPASRPEAAPSATETPEAAATNLTAEILDRTFPPRPGSVPYQDCLVSLHLGEIQGQGASALPEEVLVYTWGMRVNELVNQNLGKGDRITVTLQPWARVQDEYGGLNREELMSDAAFLLDLYWAETLQSQP